MNRLNGRLAIFSAVIAIGLLTCTPACVVASEISTNGVFLSVQVDAPSTDHPAALASVTLHNTTDKGWTLTGGVTPAEIVRADVNGDGIVDQSDIQSVLEAIAIIEAIPAEAFALLDTNDDGVINKMDLLYLRKHRVDLNGDGVFDSADIAYWITLSHQADLNQDGVVDQTDIALLQDLINQADLDGNGVVNDADIDWIQHIIALLNEGGTQIDLVIFAEGQQREIVELSPNDNYVYPNSDSVLAYTELDLSPGVYQVIGRVRGMLKANGTDTIMQLNAQAADLVRV